MAIDIVILVALELVMRIAPRMALVGVVPGSDAYAHMLFARYYRDHGEPLPWRWQGMEGVGYYPYLYHWLLALGGEVRHLSPMLLSADHVEIGGDAERLGVHLMAKSYDGSLYVIAVNPHEAVPVAPTFELPTASSSRNVDVLFENRSLKLHGNAFQDLFNPLDVHVYRIE